MGELAAKLGGLWSRLLGRPSAVGPKATVSHMPGGDQIVWGVTGQDMDEAIRAAKETLSVFWNWHETRPSDPDSCALKVKFPARGGGSEHLWFIDILRTGDLVTGMVASEPERVPGLTLWQPTVIDIGQITDWTFRKDGLYYGHFTTRVLAAAHPEVAAREPATLSETPLPADLVRH
jgi:uncharacterized protein YegJ (DUF2314 family)